MRDLGIMRAGRDKDTGKRRIVHEEPFKRSCQVSGHHLSATIAEQSLRGRTEDLLLCLSSSCFSSGPSLTVFFGRGWATECVASICRGVLNVVSVGEGLRSLTVYAIAITPLEDGIIWRPAGQRY